MGIFVRLFNMSSLLFLMLSAAFVYGESHVHVMSATCAIYQVAYPQGHSEEDLLTPIISMLPDVVSSQIDNDAVSSVTTEEFVAFYEEQEEFCENNKDVWEPVLAEVMSGEELSEESMQFLELALFETAAFLYEDSIEVVERRNLLIGKLIFVGAVVVFIGVVAVADAAGGCRRRRALAVPESGSRRLLMLKEITTGTARRALTDSSGFFDIPTMDIISACGQNIPSFVCSMTTLALTEVITSQFCGGSSSLDSCAYNTQYALGYISNGLQNTMG